MKENGYKIVCELIRIPGIAKASRSAAASSIKKLKQRNPAGYKEFRGMSKVGI